MRSSGMITVGFDLDSSKVEALGLELASSVEGLVEACDTVILAVKPQTYRDMSVDFGDKLVISIMAGVPLADLPGRAVRVMPNLGAANGKSVSSWVASELVTEDEKEFVRELLESFGVAIEVANDDEIDKMTALTGSGPAYLYEFMRPLIDKGVEMGFDPAIVRKAVDGLIEGSLEAAKGEDPAVMISRVASKGGTTEAALNVLSDDGWGETLKKAAEAAFQRSKEL